MLGCIDINGKYGRFLLKYPVYIYLLHSHPATDPWPLLNRVFQRVRSSASSFGVLYFLFFLRPSNSCLRLLPRFPSRAILSSIVPSITCFRRQFLHKMSKIQLVFIFIVRGIFVLSLTLCNTSSFFT